jgi:hypothetical protein
VESPRKDEHPVREALLELLRTHAELTSAQAARELGGNTGLYSFHLRKLAEQGLVEDVPGATGRVRPWRLVQDTPGRPAGPPRPAPRRSEPSSTEPDLGGLNRTLEDESYQRWRAARHQVPPRWQHDEAFSEVIYLTPEEMATFGDAIRSMIGLFRHREDIPAARPADAVPVAVVARLFPMLDLLSEQDTGDTAD